MYKEALALSPPRSSDQPVTGAAVLLLLRRLWNRLGIGVWLDDRLAVLPDQFRPSLMIQIWVTLLFYGGGWMADLEWFGRRGVRRLFGWARVSVPSTFGRWLRLARAPVADILEELIRRIVRLRWERRGVPVSLALVLDSTVILRYGTEQAGPECGYNPPGSQAGRAITQLSPSMERRDFPDAEMLQVQGPKHGQYADPRERVAIGAIAVGFQQSGECNARKEAEKGAPEEESKRPRHLRKQRTSNLLGMC